MSFVKQKKETIDEKNAGKQRQLAAIRPHQWKPGQSGNPAGPPKARVGMYRHFCKFAAMTKDELDRLDKTTLTMSQLAALAMLKNVVKGEWPQQKEVIERDEGKVKESIDMNHNIMTPEEAARILKQIDRE